MFKSKFYFMLVIASFLMVLTAQAQEAKIRVLLLSATSSQDPQFDLTSLLDDSAKVGWKPGIAGTGAEEGISIQFEQAVKPGAIVLKGKGDFVVSINGREIQKGDGYFSVPGNSGVRTLFIHVASHPSGPVDLTGIKLVRGGVALPVEKPLILSGEVKAVNVLSPELVYGPFRLFDSRPDLALALDGKKIDTSKPVPLFDLKLANSVKLKGFFIWNGYQRSDDLYIANARPKEITVQGGTTSAHFVLKDKMGPQWFPFPQNSWDVSSLSFEADSIFPGRDYPDLVVSEICFVTDQDQILMLKIPRPNLPIMKGMREVLDKTLVSFPGQGDGEYSLKLRSDGTFAAFQKTEDETGEASRKIWEGNWQSIKPNKIRVFGKSYSSEPSQDATIYGNEVSTPKIKTFQTFIQIKALNDLKPADRDRISKFVKAAKTDKGSAGDTTNFWNQLKDQAGAIFVESNLFSQVMVLDEFKK